MEMRLDDLLDGGEEGGGDDTSHGIEAINDTGSAIMIILNTDIARFGNTRANQQRYSPVRKYESQSYLAVISLYIQRGL